MNEETRSGVWERLRSGLSRSRDNMRRQFSEVFRRSNIDEELWEDVEAILIGADTGVHTTLTLIDHLRDETRARGITDPQDLWDLLEASIAERMPPSPPLEQPGKLTVLLVVGVNGTGKTTTIAKIASHAKDRGEQVILAAADTYRAAAIEQLIEWGKRIDVDVVAHQRKSDPSAVVFDAVQAAKARAADLLLVDTAGRLHTYENLMQELAKIRRVAEKEVGESGTVKSLLVLDATTGQNGLLQAQMFSDFIGIDAIALTKLDGTAKGGIVLAIQDELKIPVAYVGLGEKLDDLQPFDPSLYATAFVGHDRQE